MITDRLLQVSTDQVVTANARSTDTIDLKQDRDIGIGEPMYFVVSVKSVSGTSPTLQVGIQTDDTAAFSSPATIAQTAAIAVTAGSMIVVPLPRANERHLSMFYTVGGTSPSFTLDAYLSAVPPAGWQAYPGAIVN
jgi:hypothetical protein